jgi:hypothetical protein
VTRTVRVTFWAKTDEDANTLFIASPLNGSTYHASDGMGPVTLTLTARAPIGTESVQYALDGIVAGSSAQPPYTVAMELDPADAGWGEHHVTATAKLATTGETIADESTFTLSAIGVEADVNHNGLADNPFSTLALEGDVWSHTVAVPDTNGNRVTAIWTTGTDLGTQNASFISLEAYRDLFKPFHKAVNDWLHEHTEWKSMIHSCGSVRSLIEDFIDAGFDILNPVQCSAANMNPSELKSAFGDRITFWGGGVDTQHTLPFGTPKEVRKEVRNRIKTVAPGGGFVFATVHNIQARVPVENLLAMFETVQESRSYR